MASNYVLPMSHSNSLPPAIHHYESALFSIFNKPECNDLSLAIILCSIFLAARITYTRYIPESCKPYRRIWNSIPLDSFESPSNAAPISMRNQSNILPPSQLIHWPDRLHYHVEDIPRQISSPVMKLDSGLTSMETRFAMSAGIPRRLVAHLLASISDK